ncbi:hypothetical protein V7056_17145 [Bacillus sp. JJ664]
MGDYHFTINMIRNIIVTFFQNGIWVVGFFYLLNKTVSSKTLLKASKIIMIIVFVCLLLYSIDINR